MSDSASTSHALLDAAESLFARDGFAEASLRSITAAAGANLGAVNYHFGSKLGLLRAVLERRLGPVNAERLRRLAAWEETERGLEALVRAFVEPPLDLLAGDTGPVTAARLVLRAFTEPGDEVRGLLEEQFGEVARRFLAALTETLPHVSPADLHWRFHFLVGSMAFTLGLGDVVEKLSDGASGPASSPTVREALIAFAVRGLREPQAGARGGGA